jgi:type III secretory pathway component EscS
MTTPAPDPHGPEDGSRPRPQYGEYASAEEQRARIREPQPPFAPPAASAPSTPSTSGPAPQAPPPLPTWGAPSPVAPARHPHPIDRIVTIVLLAWGAVNVVYSAISYANLPAFAAQAYRIMDVQGEFTNLAAGRLWGVIAAVALVVGYLVTLMLAVRNLRRRRLAWWIPVVGAVVTFLVVYVCLAIPLLGDPAFMQYVSSR